MIDLQQFEVWFITGSQHLYGPKTLEQVADHSKEIAAAFDASKHFPVKVIFKPVLTTPDAIRDLCLEANSAKNCIGLITWMHTFSPAKMWIAGLTLLKKPFAHLHTQYNREIPWAEIDMNFMNLNQAAHGDREFGFIGSRLRLDRKVVVGHWQDDEVQRELGVWTRAASAWADWQGAKVARFGDNMRDVAVTEGDKVQAQIQFGYDVYGYGVGDLVKAVNDTSDAPDCGAVFHRGRWSWEPAPPEAAKHLCPACVRIRGRAPKATLTLRGAWFAVHRDEILSLIDREARLARDSHPLSRVMGIETGEDGSTRLTTTDGHLARRLAEALSRAGGGALEVRSDRDRKHTQMVWER